MPTSPTNSCTPASRGYYTVVATEPTERRITRPTLEEKGKNCPPQLPEKGGSRGAGVVEEAPLGTTRLLALNGETRESVQKGTTAHMHTFHVDAVQARKGKAKAKERVKESGAGHPAHPVGVTQGATLTPTSPKGP